jgi:Zn-dependent protease with chaperone function
MLPVFAFLMGRELGRLQLGHARWVNDLLLAYIARIPYLKNPLMRLFTYSEDRWGAFLAPESLPSGLVAMAAGRRMLPEINMADYLESVHGYSSVWAFLADWTSETPPIARRINALIDAGLVAAEGRAQGATSFTRQHR